MINGDDLDYFVNDHPDFLRITDRQISTLSETFGNVNIALRSDNFLRLFVAPERLKIEMINDVPAHIGVLVNHPSLGVIDSKENIFSNKLTALVDRNLPKDLADIYVLLNDGFSIKKAPIDANSKAAGIAPMLVVKLLLSLTIRCLIVKFDGSRRCLERKSVYF